MGCAATPGLPFKSPSLTTLLLRDPVPASVTTWADNHRQ